MRTIQFWEVFETSDGRDRRPIANFSSEFAAQEVAKLKNQAYRAVQAHTVVIHESVDEFKRGYSEELKNRAIKKLSTDELDALREFFQKNPNVQIALR
jgi:hypothetical protein